MQTDLEFRPRTTIDSNGSRWFGQAPATVDWTDADLDTAFSAFELPPATAKKLEQPTRPTRRRAGWKSTNTRDADIAELTNRPAKRTRR